jgi:hypothetical protein
MSIRATSWAWTVQTTPTAKLVLVALADFADEAGLCWPRVSVLVEMTCLSERTVRTAIATLTAAGLIVTDQAVGRGNTSKYRLGINLSPEKVREMQVLQDAEKVQLLPEKVQLLPQKVQLLPEKVQELHPEPPLTIKNHHEPPKTRAARAVASVPEVVLPAWLPPDAWADWCDYRTKKDRRSWTQKAAELTIREIGNLNGQGQDPRALIEQAIMRGWQGIYPLKTQSRSDEKPRPWWLEDMISERH